MPQEPTLFAICSFLSTVKVLTLLENFAFLFNFYQPLFHFFKESVEEQLQTSSHPVVGALQSPVGTEGICVTLDQSVTLVEWQ